MKTTKEYGPDDLLGQYLETDFEEALVESDAPKNISDLAKIRFYKLTSTITSLKVKKSTLLVACFLIEDGGIDVVVDCQASKRRLSWTISNSGDIKVYLSPKVAKLPENQWTWLVGGE